MVARGAADDRLKVRGAVVERMSRSPFLANVAPVGGAVGIFVSQMKAMSEKAGLVGRGSVLLTELNV